MKKTDVKKHKRRFVYQILLVAGSTNNALLNVEKTVTKTEYLKRCGELWEMFP